MFTASDLIVGVDVHRRTNVTQVMDGTGQVVERPGRFANNRMGTDQLVDCLVQIAAMGDYRAIHIAAEATNNFWLPFFCQLIQSEPLSAWPLALYPFNPRVIHNFKKALGDLEKTDDWDAGVGAERSGKWRFIRIITNLSYARNAGASFYCHNEYEGRDHATLSGYWRPDCRSVWDSHSIFHCRWSSAITLSDFMEITGHYQSGGSGQRPIHFPENVRSVCEGCSMIKEISCS
jgi:hypothetical protein